MGVTTQKKQDNKVYHRFLDEAGDTTFWGKGGRTVVGEQGVSLSFGIGMVKIRDDLDGIRKKVTNLQQKVEHDEYLNIIPSIRKKIGRGGFYFHATDDPPEVRQLFYNFIHDIDCSLEMIVGRKIPSIYINKHHKHESEFYADILSHLLKNKLRAGRRLVLNIANRGTTTSNQNLQLALLKATSRALKKHEDKELKAEVTFNVQNHRTEPILNIADYLCWAVQRVFERGEIRYYNYLQQKISLVVDLYDVGKYEGSNNYYRRDNPLTSDNKLSPPSP